TVTLPGLSAFVGGDIVAGILACGMETEEEIPLLVDLGTNGELALGNRERILCCGTAAGPAFEGGGDIWGADMIALTAHLMRQGLVDDTGLLAEPYFEQGISIGGVQITQERIRQLQTAKAAICAGINTLIAAYGLTGAEQVSRVFLAGGFGYFLDVEAAVELGLIPQGLEGRVTAVGNTALAGPGSMEIQWMGKKERSGSVRGRRC
ncbi:MAG: ASKHA domain-containing protein, partial [Acetatifactor sp.]|nr:ASKHA domain-containing protein [Acetatifactor sp.]